MKKIDASKRDALLRALKHKGVSRRNTVSVTSIEHSDRRGVLRLSWSQQRLWFLEQLDDLGSAYHISGAFVLSGDLNEQALQRALDEIVLRHESLRTVFVHDEESLEPQQKIVPASGFDLRRQDLRALPEQSREDAKRQALRDANRLRFDLEKGPLIRGLLIRLSEKEHLLWISMHHIISDGWSIGVMIRELATLYAAFSEGRGSPLPVLPIQYVDYAQWQRRWLTGERLSEQLAFWKEELSGAPSLLELPTDRPRPAVQSYAGAAIDVSMDMVLTRDLNELARKHDVTLFMVLQAGMALLLGRLSGQDDVVLGTAVANRRRSELEGLIGFFVNTIALRTRIDPEQRVSELLKEVKDRTLASYEHQDVPFEQVVEVIRPERSMSHHPVFQAMLVLQNTPKQELRLSGLTISSQPLARENSQFDLSLSLSENESGLVGELEYSEELFDRETVERWMGHLKVLLGAMAQDDELEVKALPLLSDGERDHIVKSFNSTQEAYPQEALIHELFERQVKKAPDDIALQYGDESLSYATLNRRANQLAHALRERGVGPESRVAICIERSLEMVVGLLGILKAGGAYVPVDPDYPTERVSYILKDAAADVLLTQRRLLERLNLAERTTGAVLCIDENECYDAYPLENISAAETGQTSKNLAYVIYTSGSTGTPKGVMIEHRSAVNRLCWMPSGFRITPEDRVLQKTAFSFDVSVWEFFWTLLHGARLIMARPQGHQDPAYLADTIMRYGITMVDFVPSMLEIFLENAITDQCQSLKYMFCGGEELNQGLLKRCQDKLPHTSIYHMYGPTEASVDASYWRCSIHPRLVARVPIGRPVANTRMYILDAQGQPVPIGVSGEIFIAGDGVARGYMNQPELTAERFVPDPFSEQVGARMYKTGDLGRWRPDGSIEYLGRNDFQVKIRGMRIELGEIESRICDLPAVREAVVIAREDSPGDKRLVAYVTLKENGADATAGSAEPAAEALRAHLKDCLPAYMIPSAFVKLNRMPLTPNGKVDRKALPAPDMASIHVGEYQAPRAGMESVLATIWQGLLGTEKIGRNDNFFDLGGHSLLLVKLMARMKAEGFDLSLQQFFKYPTISEQSEVLTNELDLNQQQESLVCLRQGGDEPPLFLVHEGSGDILSYIPLARFIGKNVPIHAVNALYFDPHDEVFASVESMARVYVSLIETIQPKGPYRLAGWSAGGVIAYEMGRRLRQKNEEVQFVAMIDSYVFSTVENEHNTLSRSEELILHLRKENPGVDPSLFDKLDAHADVDTLIKQCYEQGLLTQGMSAEESAHRFGVAFSIGAAVTSYVPEVWEGNVLQLTADELLCDIDGKQLSDRGWQHLGKHAPKIKPIGGSHLGIMKPPYLKQLADEITNLL